MQNFNQFVLDLTKLISYKSVLGNPEPDAPFGKEVKNALDYFLETAKTMGFETINHNGYIGEIIFGEGEEVGIIGHLDVVPVGIGWNTDPFSLTEKDGVYYGRGVVDDKGPTLLALYALKALKDSEKTPNKKFRFFVGCNEESGWNDIEYFNTIDKFPDYGFSPDGDFPLTYAEKGIAEVEFILDAPKNFKAISGGTALNAVCDYASMECDIDQIDNALLQKYNLKYNGKTIESFGKAAHGSRPHLGKNAIKPLLEYMTEKGENYDNVIAFLFNDALKIFEIENEQGNLTLSPNLIETQGDKLIITCDCRIPFPETTNSISKVIEKFNIPFNIKERHPPMCAGKDGVFVQTLICAYNDVTGENAKPIAMSGSTFARAFKFGCSFGPEMNNGTSGNIHDANEFITKDALLLSYEIYKKAIFDLAK